MQSLFFFTPPTKPAAWIIVSILLFLLQIYLFYSNMDTEKFKITGKLSSITSSLIYLLGVISSMCALILYTILKYFTTDG